MIANLLASAETKKTNYNSLLIVEMLHKYIGLCHPTIAKTWKKNRLKRDPTMLNKHWSLTYTCLERVVPRRLKAYVFSHNTPQSTWSMNHCKLASYASYASSPTTDEKTRNSTQDHDVVYFLKIMACGHLRNQDTWGRASYVPHTI